MKTRLIAALLATGALFASGFALNGAVEQHKRDAYCASMGEVWMDGHQDGKYWMPGQCVDAGQSI